MAGSAIISTSFTQPSHLFVEKGQAWPQYVKTQTNKQKSCGFGPAAEVMSEVMPEVISAETALNK